MKKGFTIVELLVTVSLLLLVAVLLVPNIIKMSDSVKQTQYESKLDLILSAGVDYAEDNINSLSCVDAGFLIENGYLKADSKDDKALIDPRTNKTMNCITVCLGVESSISEEGKNYFKATAKFDGTFNSEEFTGCE